jgi:GNAT superfamily N-acetyltransferase
MVLLGLRNNWLGTKANLDMHTIIREAVASDLAAILKLYRHLHALDAPLSADRAEAVWADLLASSFVKVIVAECDGFLASSCTLAIIPNLTRGARPYGVIENVVTDQTWRKKGLGHAVLERALTTAWSSRCYKVLLATGSQRPETHRFYETAGFTKNKKIYFQADAPIGA